ncbi:MAG TPA: HAD family hydrolase [Vicinamibacterales bacterium]
MTGLKVRRPLAVLFDLDDTLFDHARATRVALSALREVDLALGRWSIDELDRRHRVVLEMWHQEVLAGRASIEQARIARFTELVGQAGGDGAGHRAGELASRYRSVYETTWFTVPGARPLVEAIASQGLRVAVVTNNVRREQELKLARCGLTSLVDTLVTSEEVGAQKPDPRIFQTALDRIGVSASDAVMVGDAWPTDVEGARRAGLRPVWLNRFGEMSRDLSVSELRSLEPLAEALAAIVG